MTQDTPDPVELARNSDTSKMTSHELAEWCVAEWAAIDPEVHAEYRVDVWIAVKLARAVLEMAEAWITCPACGETWRRKDGTETHDDVCQQRDAARAEVERLRGALEEIANLRDREGFAERANLANAIARAELGGEATKESAPDLRSGAGCESDLRSKALGGEG